MKNLIRLSLTISGVASLVSFQNCAPIKFDVKDSSRQEMGTTTAPFPSPTPASSQCLKFDGTQDGSLAKPWSVDSCECFQAIETAPGDSFKTDHFRIAHDLDCSAVSNQQAGLGFTSIKYFKGYLDGNNKTINNLASTRTNASVFFGDLSGEIKDIKFNNLRLVSSASDSLASFHVVDGMAISSYSLLHVENVALENIYVEADREASGFSNRVIGLINNLKVTGTVKARQSVSGLVGELYAIRTDDPASTQYSILQNSEFNGILSSAWAVAGLVRVNLGQINNSKSTLVATQSYQNQQFTFGGLVVTNCAGGAVNNSQSFGSVSLASTININAQNTVDFIFYYGALVAANTVCSTGNPAFDQMPGSVTDSSSSIVGNVRIERVSSANASMSAHVNDLIGYGQGPSSGNSFSGQTIYQRVGF